MPLGYLFLDSLFFFPQKSLSRFHSRPISFRTFLEAKDQELLSSNAEFDDFFFSSTATTNSVHS